jgi:NtrC-family two-component system response regulator AlgB
MSKILILDDDPHILRSLEIMMKRDGHEVWSVPDAESALAFLEQQHADIAIVDLQLPGMSGLEFLRKLRDLHRDTDAIIITAHGSIESAVDAMKEGAYDYITKPFSPDQVRHRIAQVESVRGYRTEVSGLRRRLGELPYATEFISGNPAVRHLLEVARTVAESGTSILITGESGTGKGLLARLMHRWSARAAGPFAVVDCASFQESLLESELFGHKKGAFTGAVADKPGKVETANGGTLFLDEIGEAPLAVQQKMLRLIEEKTFERLGDPTPRSVDARIIAATNRDLAAMVEAREFRQDLFYRLNVVELHIPPLRKRKEDIMLLAERFLAEYNSAHKRTAEDMDQDVKQFLISHSWPGNVRELSHMLESAVLVCPGRTIRMEHLPHRVVSGHENNADEQGITPLAVLEENMIRKALSQDIPIEEAARLLGMNTTTLWRKRKKLGL